MSSLSSENCVEMTSGTKICPTDEAKSYKGEIPDWHIIFDGMEKLERAFEFDSFAEALEFTNKIGDEAENQGHHPKLTTEWGKTTVTWWTHFLGGLHKNDFIMAARTDSLAEKKSC
ncbi:MAG: 4a-hydroxytetrahydrobiopterin dehydratase [Chloroflexi bacterium]|nr:4a-hydroxytetrahydrobiopterin dehydratase [Chloroflexota bacterium]|tara:strand:- start:7170 stop:7517 length:348 start_codon:yes stop_codon:yes gene_type:complete